ncbi:acetylcholinesterase-like [Aricia agestis]|uniref:acetylcholinesterase-like n=1 Tax=Aricia agestis TaxID=91739 RepID=UPI001C20C215|nr:acetylcholinesterase-like [Aricia agestis]
MLVYAVILVLWAGSAEGEGHIVHAPAGSIRGVPAADGDYVMYLGIPYARVNASNPFGEVLPHEKFHNVFEAVKEAAICPQTKEVFDATKDKDTYDGTLDCLNLNVFVPKTVTENKATYIFVFGGKFLNGHSLMEIYGPRYLVRHDIIVVTFNFRSGPYGFMCANIPEIPGNQGLRDQYAAIEWVRDNIRAFGGDPQKLTVGGHSSGAMLVDMHLLTDRPRLFQQAILQSGVATSSASLRPSDPGTVVGIAGKLGFRTNDTYDALSFLAKANPKSVVKATEYDLEYLWRPCVEKIFEGVEPYIAKNPELCDGRNLDGLKVLGGFTDRESLFSLYSSYYDPVFNLPYDFRTFVDEKFYLRNERVLLDIVRRFYVNDEADREIVKYKIVDLFSDFSFVYPKQRQMFKYARHRNTTVYMYMFSYDGSLNRMKNVLNITEAGATHSDELGYIFTMGHISDAKYSKEQLMIDRLTTLWANFVKYGNPTPARSDLLPVSWPPLTTTTAPCLRIDTNMTVISRPFRRRMAFWDLFYDAHLDELLISPPQK